MGRAASPCSTVCLCLTAHPRPQFPHVSVCVYRGLGSLIGSPAGPGSPSGHGRPLCVSAQTMARPLSSPPGPALLLHHRGPRGFWAAGEGRLLQSAAPPSSHAAAPRAPGIPWQTQTCKFAGRSQLGVWRRARGGGGGGGSGGRGAHRLRAGRVAAAALRRVRARRGPPAAPPAAGRAGAGRGRAAEARVAGARARRAQAQVVYIVGRLLQQLAAPRPPRAAAAAAAAGSPPPGPGPAAPGAAALPPRCSAAGRA